MTELIVAAPVVTAENFEGLVRDELGKIGEGFLRIGFYLSKARDERLYIPLGYDNLYEMSEDLFDLKESSVFNMMAVWLHFHSVKNPLALRDECKGLKYSQLIECLRDKWDSKCCVTRVISATDTVKETKAKVTAWNALVGRLSRYPSLEQVEQYVAQKEEERRLTEENSKRLESSAPELRGQLPGQTSLFVEGIAEEPSEENSKRLEFSEEETTTEEVDTAPIGAAVDEESPAEDVQNSKRLEFSEEPFAGLPQETEYYAQALVQEAREKSDDIVPEKMLADVQMRIHKRQAISHIEIASQAETKEGVEQFFENAIKRLVAMRAYKLMLLKEKERCPSSE